MMSKVEVILADTAGALALEATEHARDAKAASQAGDHASYERRLGYAEGLIFAARRVLEGLQASRAPHP